MLLALTQKGASREDSYVMVQRNAMRVWKEGISYLELLKEDKDITRFLSYDELDKLFDLDQHFIHVDTIFDRVFSPTSAATQKDS